LLKKHKYQVSFLIILEVRIFQIHVILFCVLPFVLLYLLIHVFLFVLCVITDWVT